MGFLEVVDDDEESPAASYRPQESLGQSTNTRHWCQQEQPQDLNRIMPCHDAKQSDARGWQYLPPRRKICHILRVAMHRRMPENSVSRDHDQPVSWGLGTRREGTYMAVVGCSPVPKALPPSSTSST